MNSSESKTADSTATDVHVNVRVPRAVQEGFTGLCSVSYEIVKVLRDNQDSVQDQAERDARRAQAFFDAVEGQEFRNARSRIREQYADIEEQETEESRVIGEIVERAVRAKQLEQEQIEEEEYERKVRVLYRNFEELLLREAAIHDREYGSSMKMSRMN